MRALTGRGITVYGQNDVVKDLIAAREGTGRPLFFEVDNVSIHDLDSELPKIRFTRDGKVRDLRCDVIAGCDGFHGASRLAIPENHLRIYERVHPFAWLGIAVNAAPTSPELVYSRHERGFALFSMRSNKVTKLYLQCALHEDLTRWPDDRLWEELLIRLESRDGWKPKVGPITQKVVTEMRSFVAEPMRYGRLFLAGDSAHLVPLTGAKGLNLAIADAWRLSRALTEYFGTRSETLLDSYSDECLRRIWQAQRFSWWMTSMLHKPDSRDPFEDRRQLAELEYVMGSRAAMTSLAENYVGFPIT
jgi:p-hydroxybenzoate 3-monooxygenase